MSDRVLAAERRRLLARQLVRDGGIKVGQTARRFGVSTETIRKDLIHLQEPGLAHKSHGGAIPTGDLIERPTAVKGTENPRAKSELARTARELIPDRAILLLDAGSTTHALAELLAELQDLTIFTNSVPVLTALAPSPNKVFCFGGELRGTSLALAGGWAVDALRSIRVDLAFLGTDGCRGLSGPSSASYEEAQFKTEVVRASNRTVVLGDHSKFAQTGLFQFCSWDEVYALVTDTGATAADMQAIGERTRVITGRPGFGTEGPEPLPGASPRVG